MPTTAGSQHVAYAHRRRRARIDLVLDPTGACWRGNVGFNAQPARLIPVAGISGSKDAEARAASALLAVLSIVRPFSQALLTPLGATRDARAKVEAFTEISFDTPDGRTVRPDGLIRVSFGRRSGFVALVEVKTGDAKLDLEQINAYVEIARTHGYDCVVTISNEIAPSPGVHPTDGLRVRANSRVQVHHLSWAMILAEAVKEHTHRGVEDPEQAWILSELIRYLEHSKSGALEFSDMGANWTAVRDGAREGTLDRRDDAVIEVCQRWDQLLRFAALKLGAEIGSDIQEVIPKAHRDDRQQRNRAFVESICEDGTLAGTLRVPDTIAHMVVAADLKARLVTVGATFDAPRDRGGRARVTWLTRQLRDAEESLIIETYARGARVPVASDLKRLREDPRLGLDQARKEPVRFRVLQRSEMGQGRRSARKLGFIDGILNAVNVFYGDVLQNLRAVTPSAPRLERRVDAEPGNDPASAD